MKADRTDQKLASDKFVQPDAASNDVAAGSRQIARRIILGEEGFNGLGLNECDILAGFVMLVEVTVAFDSGTGNDLYSFMRCLRTARPLASINSFDAHAYFRRLDATLSAAQRVR